MPGTGSAGGLGHTLLSGVEHPEDGRLLQAYAPWQVLRRARRRASTNTTGQTPTSVRRAQLLAAARLSSWLDQQGATLANCRQGQLDRWLTAGPPGYPVRDFLNWTAEHHHCPTMVLPTLGRTTGTAIDADERWALVSRLLHDDTLEVTDRVAGSLLLCYGQQLSRIAVMTIEQVHRHDGVVAMRFGAQTSPPRSPCPACSPNSSTPAAATAVSARPPPAHGCSPGTYQDGRSPPPGSANGCGYSASEPSPDAAPPGSNSPPRSPPPSSPNSCT